MAISNLSADARNAGVDAIAALLNGGDVQLRTSGGTTLLVTLTLNATACAAAAAGSAAFNAITGANAVAAGVAAVAHIRDSGGNVEFHASVGASSSGEDIELDNTNIANGQAVALSGPNTLSMPAAA